MPNYSVRWEIQIDAESPLEAASEALKIQRDPTSTAIFFEVQISGLDLPNNWDTIDLTPEDGSPELNPWQLYSNPAYPGWQDCAARLDARLAGELALLDIRVAAGEALRVVAREVQEQMVRFMDMPQNSPFGAGNTESRFHLWSRVDRHIKATYPGIPEWSK